MKKNIFAVFNKFQEADDALIALDAKGYGHENISVIGQEGVLKSKDVSNTAEDAGKGAGVGGLLGLIAGVAALPIPGVGPIIGTGSIIGGLFGGAGLGAAVGGLIGIIQDMMGKDEKLAGKYEGAIKEGKIMLGVTADENDITEVRRVLEDHGGRDLHEKDI